MSDVSITLCVISVIALVESGHSGAALYIIAYQVLGLFFARAQRKEGGR